MWNASPSPPQVSGGKPLSLLRYCPICVAEHNPAYYSLLWRFLVLPGCLEHRVALLDQCGHCGSPLPLLRPLPQLLKCPTCQGDLRNAPSRLSDRCLRTDRTTTDDLKMLLTSEPRPQGKNKRSSSENDFSSCDNSGICGYQKLRIFWVEIASVIRDIDYLNRFRQASLDDYMQYAAVLEILTM